MVENAVSIQDTAGEPLTMLRRTRSPPGGAGGVIVGGIGIGGERLPVALF